MINNVFILIQLSTMIAHIQSNNVPLGQQNQNIQYDNAGLQEQYNAEQLETYIHGAYPPIDLMFYESCRLHVETQFVLQYFQQVER